jgi:two-component system, probable response regulator PhcQ
MQQHRVLIIDDEENILSSLRRTLRGESFEIITATDPQEGITHAEHGDVSLIISDHQMPLMTGVELFKKIKTINPTIIRIMLTGRADIEDTVNAINEGEVFRFIRKPWDDIELKITIRHALMQYDLWSQNQFLKGEVKKQQEMLMKLETEYPGITQRGKIKGGKEVFTIHENALPDTIDELVLEYFPVKGAVLAKR